MDTKFTIIILLMLNSVFASAFQVEKRNGPLKIGWATADITPDRPVLLAGQFYARVSEGVLDPVTATVLVLSSEDSGEKAVLISCDLVSISDGTRDDPEANFLKRIRTEVSARIPQIKPEDIAVNATHTHAAPYCGTAQNIEKRYGVHLDAMSPMEYLEFATGKITKAVEEAWSGREEGGISYGLTHAVVGHNRLQAEFAGKSRMYGNTDRDDFSHIEGFEDHSVHVLYTWNRDKELTGMAINIACPSQVSEHEYRVSADYWHDVRVEVREKLGEGIYVLPQCSAAGDQSPHFMYASKGEERMQSLLFPEEDPGRGSLARRKQIAQDVVAAVNDILPVMKSNIDWTPVFMHKAEVIELDRRLLHEEDLQTANEGSAEWKAKYEEALQEVNSQGDKKNDNRWYRAVTYPYGRYRWFSGVQARYEQEKVQPTIPIEVHVLRIGDIAMATNPFELYVDYGTRIKARSPAVQTFLVQLTGSGSYVPTARSIRGGAYGAVASSTLIGPEGGQQLVEETLKMIKSMWLDQ